MAPLAYFEDYVTVSEDGQVVTVQQNTMLQATGESAVHHLAGRLDPNHPGHF
jgi:hypothetical protein